MAKSRSASRSKKFQDIQSEVLLLDQGKVAKGRIFSTEDVLKYTATSAPISTKPVKAKIAVKKIEFKDKVVLGSRSKKTLEYEDIKMLSRVNTDSRLLFINYEKPKEGYFMLLKFTDPDHVKQILQVAKADKPDIHIERIEALNTDSTSNSRRSTRRSMSDTQPTTYHEGAPSESQGPSGHPVNQRQSDSISNSHRGGPHTATSSFICADPHVDDRSIFSATTPDTFYYSPSKPDDKFCGDLSRGKSYDDSADISVGEMYPKKRSTTHYYYIGPSDEEDSVVKSHNNHHSSSKPGHHKKSGRGRRSHFEDHPLAASPETYYTDNDYYLNGALDPVNGAPRPPRAKSNMSRKSSRRSKSRELPLSEAEKKRDGWHSDVLFVTPTKNGGVKISADGPVMLYTATRANRSRDYDDSSDDDNDDDDDGTSDGESEFSYNSGTTLTLEGAIGNPAQNSSMTEYAQAHR